MTVDSLTEQQEAATSAPRADTSASNGTSSEATPEANGSQSAASETAEEPAKPKRGRPKGGTAAKKTRTVELTLTVTGTADGEWQAELKHGSKWVARGLEIPAAAVSRAAKELHEELSVPIDEVINAAREQQQQKVAQLEAELEQAKQALAELDA